MAKYIDCESLLKSLSQECKDCENNFGYDCEECDYAHAILYVKAEKTADVQPVHRGNWEIFWQNGKPKLKCTNCHSLFDIRTNDKHICIYPKFCEECGADMRGEENG